MADINIETVAGVINHALAFGLVLLHRRTLRAKVEWLIVEVVRLKRAVFGTAAAAEPPEKG